VKLLSKSTTTESKFRSILKSFRERTGIIYSSIINEDGLIIVVDQASLKYDDDFDQSLGAISASILAFAQNGIAMLNELQDVKSLIIQAGHEIENESFMIIIESIGQEVSLMSIFPTSLNVSLILFELKQITQKLLGILKSEEKTEINAKISSTI